MKLKILFSFLILVLAYFLFWPTIVTPENYTSEEVPKLEGRFAKNDKLKAIDILFEGNCKGCEDVDVDSSGNVYGASEDGRIMKFVDGKQQVLANTNGRPLGIHFDKHENLIVGDAQKGLLLISPDGTIEVLETTYGDIPFLFTDDVDLSKDGIIYFTDASHKFHNEVFKLDFIEHRPNGRFFSYDPNTKITTLLMEDLYFANGVALSENEDFVLVNETSANRVKRYWLKGDLAGTSEIFLDNLPFYPDGVSRGEDGIFWIAMQSPRNKLSESMSNKPFLRKMLSKIPHKLLPNAKNYSFVLGVNENAEIIYNLQDPDAKFGQITSIHQVGNKLYLGSLVENGIGVYELK